MMIDTHCHLNKEDYENFDEIMDHMKDYIMIASGADMKSNYQVVELCNKYSNVYGVLGIHPNEIEEYTIENKEWLKVHLKDPKIVGIGEIGLDYHYGKESSQKQKQVFIDQINLAKELHLPIVIHSRDASQDTFDILKEYAKDMKIDIHCYSGSLELAREYQKLGCRFGIGGVLTFKNAGRILDVVKELPLSSFLLETDAPYLTPEPFRGKKNEPYNIYYVAQKIAEIKGISLEEVLLTTTRNSISQFDLPIQL